MRYLKYEVSKTVKIIGTESGMVVARGRREGRMGNYCSIGRGSVKQDEKTSGNGW